MKLISADGHIDLPYIPEDIFRDAAEGAMKERVPHREGPGIWTYRGNRLFQNAMKVPESRVTARMRPTGIFDGIGEPGRSRAGTPALRREDQGVDGIDGDVIYGLLGIDGYMKDDPEAFRFCLHTYYRWVADFAQSEPGRFAPLGTLCAHDPVAAAEDVHMIKELGLKGFEIRPRNAIKPFWHDDWEPLWRAATETGLPVHFHSDITRLFGQYSPPEDDPRRDHYGKVLASLLGSLGKMLNAENLGTMILSGVLERHPDMVLVMGESDISWIPHYLERMDYCVTEREHGTGLPLLPSQYWRRQCKATFQSDALGVKLIDYLGVDNVMWGNDYPHPDGVWPHSQTICTEQGAVLSPEDREKVYYTNAARLYGLGAAGQTSNAELETQAS